jgi:cation diffusion facilitator family transporter
VSQLVEVALPRDPASRAAILSIYMNAALMVLKVVVGVAAGSVAVLSDGIDSGQDLIAALLAFVSVRIGARPADAGHPYGHGRAETVAAGFQGALIGIGGVFIVVSAVRRLLDPPNEVGYDVALVAMLIAAAANAALVQYTGRVARETGSPAMVSETRHLWTNVVQAGVVMAGLALVGITGEVAFDALLALVLGIYLLWTAGHIIWSVFGDVLDASLTREEIDQVREAIAAEGGHSFHDLRTRRSGQSRHIDFHLTLPGDMTVEASHAIADRIEARIGTLWPRTVVTVHIEPALEVEQSRACEPKAESGPR